jgi:hypothetical protein
MEFIIIGMGIEDEIRSACEYSEKMVNSLMKDF